MSAILLAQAVACGFLSAIIASGKNRSVPGWGAIGFFFGVIGFIASVAVGEIEPKGAGQPSKEKGQPSGNRKFNAEEHEKKCPDCAEYIKLEAQVCRYCGRSFSKEAVDEKIREAKQDWEEKDRGSNASIQNSLSKNSNVSDHGDNASNYLTLIVILIVVGLSIAVVFAI